VVVVGAAVVVVGAGAVVVASASVVVVSPPSEPQAARSMANAAINAGHAVFLSFKCVSS
jgi:hypothetical protein